MSPHPPKILLPPLFLCLFIITAYAVSHLGVPLTRLTYLLITLLSISFLALLNHQPAPQKQPHTASNSPKLLLLMPSLLTFSMFYLGFHTYLVPPNNHDIPNHYYLTSQILHTQSLKLDKVFQGHVGNSWYMLGLHALLAGIMSLLQLKDLNRVLFPLIWLLTALYPLAVYYFTRMLTQKPRISLIAAYLSVTFSMFPTNVFGWGGWPISLGMTLMYFALGEVHRLTALPKPPVSRALLPLFLLLNGLFLVHTTEVFVFVLLALPLVWLKPTPTLALIKKALPLTAINLLLLSPLLFQSTDWLQSTLNPQTFSHQSFSQTLGVLYYIHTSFNHDYVFTFFALVGLYLLFKRHRDQALKHNLISLYLLWFFRNTSTLTDALNRYLFPLFEPDRLYAYLGGLLAPTAATAVVYLSTQITRRYFPRSLPGSRAFTLCLLTVFSLVLPFIQNTRIFAHHLIINTTVTAQDLALIKRNQTRCPIYLNDDLADAGRFIPFFSHSQILLPGPSPLLPDYTDRLDLLHSTSDPRQTDQLCSLKDQFPFDCIYVGARDNHTFKKTLHADQLKNHPHLTLLDQEGGSAIFTLTCPP